MDAMEFGSSIRERRKKMGLTQKYLAALSDTGTRFISDLENGKPTVQLEKALHVAKVLNIVVEVKLNG